MKKTTWVFLYIKCSKFWSVSLEQFIERKPLISEECVCFGDGTTNHHYHHATYMSQKSISRSESLTPLHLNALLNLSPDIFVIWHVGGNTRFLQNQWQSQSDILKYNPCHQFAHYQTCEQLFKTVKCWIEPSSWVWSSGFFGGFEWVL